MNLGMKVTLLHARFGPTVLRNVTGIHYGYNHRDIQRLPATIRPESHLRELKVAFESDIHGTGCTYTVSEIVDFETALEAEKAEHF